MTTKEKEPFVFTLPQSPSIHTDQPNDDLKIRLRHVADDDEGEDNVAEDEEGDYISHDVGFVMWPAAVLLARWVAQHPQVLFHPTNQSDGVVDAHPTSSSSHQHRILELGAGCGLVGITAAAMLHQYHQQEQHEHATDAPDRKGHGDASSSVVLTDYNPKVLENLQQNLLLNGLSEYGSTAGLDFFDQPGNQEDIHEGDYHHHGAQPLAGEEVTQDAQTGGWVDMDGHQHSQVDLILAADILCYSNDATMVANTIQSSLVQGGKAVVVSGTARFGAAAFPDACQAAGLRCLPVETFPHPTTVEAGDTDVDPQRLQADLLMFTVEKPSLPITTS